MLFFLAFCFFGGISACKTFAKHQQNARRKVLMLARIKTVIVRLFVCTRCTCAVQCSGVVCMFYVLFFVGCSSLTQSIRTPESDRHNSGLCEFPIAKEERKFNQWLQRAANNIRRNKAKNNRRDTRDKQSEDSSWTRRQRVHREKLNASDH